MLQKSFDWVPSLYDNPRILDLDLVPRASAQTADMVRLLNFWKISFQDRVMHVTTWIEEIGSNLEETVWQFLSLDGHGLGPRGPIDLDSFSWASAHQAFGAGLLNSRKTPF